MINFEKPPTPNAESAKNTSPETVESLTKKVDSLRRQAKWLLLFGGISTFHALNENPLLSVDFGNTDTTKQETIKNSSAENVAQTLYDVLSKNGIEAPSPEIFGPGATDVYYEVIKEHLAKPLEQLLNETEKLPAGPEKSQQIIENQKAANHLNQEFEETFKTLNKDNVFAPLVARA